MCKAVLSNTQQKSQDIVPLIQAMQMPCQRNDAMWVIVDGQDLAALMDCSLHSLQQHLQVNTATDLAVLRLHTVHITLPKTQRLRPETFRCVCVCLPISW